ncbi:MAG TPA: hypothetical protein VN671_01660 [Solirubrobacterales bacterium]|nr:hypothetical protein [Solirubrobacterales bacterium]
MRPRRSRNLRSIGICAAIAVGASLGVLAPAAMAAPANDHFADRAPLTGPLPIEVSESNAGATAEEGGEFIALRGFAAHHSLWWEWEAPTSEVVAVGACGSEMPTVVGVFTGDEFPPQALSADFNTGGPECSSQVIFNAVAGTVYDIGADGESFYIPGTERPSGEGTIKLRIAALPPPPNDAFAAATPLSEQVWELPGGERQLLGAASGYNWGATTEPGEPLATAGAGASIWFRWTPRESGRAIISTAPGYETDESLAVYAGGALASLVPIGSSDQRGSPISFAAEADREYRIAVDGVAPPGGEPWMGNVHLTVGEFLAPGPGTTVERPISQDPADPGAAPAAAAPTVSQRPDKPQARTASHRSGKATKSAKKRCAVHSKRHKACSAGARFEASARHRRHHAAG